jgi:hypothetical protein
MTNESFLEGVERELRRLRRLGDCALEQVTDEGFFWLPAREVNSAAVLVKHLSGNMIYRWRDFPNSDGEPGRDRDVEFQITSDDTRAALERDWNRGWETLLDAVKSLAGSDLSRVVRIRREPHTV